MNFFKNLFTPKQQKNDRHDFKAQSSNEIQFSDDEKSLLIDLIARQELKPAIVEINYRNPMFKEIATKIIVKQKFSESILKREFTYNKLQLLIQLLEDGKIISLVDEFGNRNVLYKNLSELDNFLKIAFLLNGNWNSKEFCEKYLKEIESKKIFFLNQVKENEIHKEKELIKSEILENENKKQLKREVWKELVDQGLLSNHFTNNNGKRESIPQEIMDKVWNRDGGKCIQCLSSENLEFDHIIPFSKGGATTYRNMQLLCKRCNIKKSNFIG